MGESHGYYSAFAQIIRDGYDWVINEYGSGVKDEDMVVFKVGQIKGYVKDSIVSAIDSDPVRRVCERDYVVHYMKMTNYNSGNSICRTYRSQYENVGMINVYDEIVFRGVGNCRFMPDGGREAEGKFVCDQVDSVGRGAASINWVMDMKYSEIVAHPSIVRHISEDVVKCVSLGMYIGRGLYRENMGFDGTIVVPLKLMVSQIADMKRIVDELGV